MHIFLIGKICETCAYFQLADACPSLCRLFKRHHDVKEMFPFARGKEWDQICDDVRLRAHVNSVMYALTSFIDNLGDIPCLDVMVRKLADSHAKRHVTGDHFKVRKDLL